MAYELPPDVECPYCEKGQEINHDDGYGYAEGEVFEQQCGDCGMVYTYTTNISFSYDAEKAPCKNGEPHDLQPIRGAPAEYFVGKKRCSVCQEDIMVDRKAHKDSMRAYNLSLMSQNLTLRKPKE